MKNMFNSIKSFSFKLPTNEQSTGSLKERLLSSTFNRYPYLSDDSTSRKVYAVPTSYYPSYSRYQTCPCADCQPYRYNVCSPYSRPLGYSTTPIPTYTTGYDLYSSYTGALNVIDIYAKRHGSRVFDLIVDGQVIRVRDGYIQIGSTVIPQYVDRSYFDRLPSYTRTEITTITIKIIRIYSL